MKRRRYLRYSLALAAAAAGAVFRVALLPVLGNGAPGVTFLPAIIASAWYGGLESGIACTVFSYAVARYFLITPGSLVIHAGEVVQLCLYLLAGALVAWITAALQRARARVEQAQREAVTILDSVSDGVVALDDQFRFTYLNAAAERMTGQTRRELIGKTLWEIYPATAGTMTEREYRRAMGERVPASFEHYYEPGNRWFEVHAFPADTGGLSVYSRDITERKHQEQELSRLNRELAQRVEELETILNLAPVGLAIAADANGDQIRANAHLNQLTGTSSGEARYSLFLNNQELRPEQMPLRRTLREGCAIPSAEYKLVQPDGNELFVLGQATPLFEADGTVRGAIGAFTDITERKQVEHSLRDANRMLERSNADLQQFAYAVAHDLQEPLRTLTSYCDMIARRYRDKLDADGVVLIDFVAEGSSRMQNLIRDLLSYCRAIDSPEDTALPIDCAEIVGYVLANLQSRVEECNAVVTHEGLPTILMAQPQLTHVFQNLIGNALKYRREEPPSIHISAKQQGPEWVFAVRDNGLGIERRHRELIFGLFRRLHGAQIPGTGIGLAICKRIVEHNGGRIWVESEPGRGSTFYFTLPESIVTGGAAKGAAI